MFNPATFTMRSLFLCFLPALFTSIGAVEFINPPPFESTTDFSLNTVFVEGSIMNIQWTPGPPENNTSLTLFQLNGTQFLTPFEYLTINVSPSITSLAWTVQTGKNLTLSNMFYLCIFLQGGTTSEANSHYFNITSQKTTSPSASTQSSTTTTSSSIQLSPTGSTPTPASTDVPAPGPEGLSTNVKAALGVGIPAAVILGITIGWFIFRRQSKQNMFVQTAPATETVHNEHEKYGGQVLQVRGEDRFELPTS